MNILSHVGTNYDEGINPIKIGVENKFVRAVTGGTGEAKTGGNYAASLAATEKVAQKGFSQVLWLDGVEKKYIEEVGSMNIFFKINGEIKIGRASCRERGKRVEGEEIVREQAGR